MSGRKRDYEIAAMQAVLATLLAVQRGEAPHRREDP